MLNMRYLKRVAKRRAYWKGHEPTRFLTLNDHHAVAHCKHCLATLYVTNAPAYDDVDLISGSMLEYHCPKIT